MRGVLNCMNLELENAYFEYTTAKIAKVANDDSL